MSGRSEAATTSWWRCVVCVGFFFAWPVFGFASGGLWVGLVAQIAAVVILATILWVAWEEADDNGRTEP